MPYFGQGVASYPIRPGHEVTGLLISSPDGALKSGVPVLIDPVVGCGVCSACASGVATQCPDRKELGIRRGMPGGACDLIAVPIQNLHRIPANVALRDAVLVEPGVTVLNAVQRLGDVAERRALVIGAGTLGLIAGQLLVRRGAIVDVVVVQECRSELVDRLGARPIKRASSDEYAVVLEAAGQADAVRAALAAVAPGGVIALTGVQPGAVMRLDINQIVLKDATVLGVLNGPGLYDVMLDELASGSLDASLLIDAEFELEDAEAALAAVMARDRMAPKVILRIAAH
jgi:threonine dehydrogenase-like Zn-dependent dehydrogenase